MTWVAVGVAGAALLGSVIQSNAASDAASSQSASAHDAINAQLGMYQQTRSDSAPWRNAGLGALGQLSWLLGIPGGISAKPTNTQHASTWIDKNGDVVPPPSDVGMMQDYADMGYRQQAALSTGSLPNGMAKRGGDPGTFGALTRGFTGADFQADPGYAFRYQQGLEALQRSGSAAGQTLSGAQLKALTEYGQGMGSQEYGNAFNRWNTNNTNTFNRLASVAGLGQQANAQIGAAGMNSANQIGGYYGSIGNANAANSVAQGNIWSSGLNSAMNQYQLSQLSNGGWGSGSGYGSTYSNPNGEVTGPYGTNGSWSSTYTPR